MMADHLGIDHVAGAGQHQRRGQRHFGIVGLIADAQTDLGGRGQLRLGHARGLQPALHPGHHVIARRGGDLADLILQRGGKALALRGDLFGGEARDLRRQRRAIGLGRSRDGTELLAQSLGRIAHRGHGLRRAIRPGFRRNGIAIAGQRQFRRCHRGGEIRHRQSGRGRGGLGHRHRRGQGRQHGRRRHRHGLRGHRRRCAARLHLAGAMRAGEHRGRRPGHLEIVALIALRRRGKDLHRAGRTVAPEP